jgi:hypothetical protein
MISIFDLLRIFKNNLNIKIVKIIFLEKLIYFKIFNEKLNDFVRFFLEEKKLHLLFCF